VVALVAGLAVVVLLIASFGGPIGDGAEPAATTPTLPTTIPIDPEDRPFCDAFGALLAGPLADPETNPNDPASLEAAAASTQAILDAMVAAAPEELVEPVGVVADEYRAALEVFARYGYSLDRVATEATPEDQAVLDEFGAPGSAADVALEPVEAWVGDRCATDALPDLDD
jgi:hypothetical protein